MKRRLAISVAALLSGTIPASAFEMSHTVTLGYGSSNLSDDNGEFTSKSLDYVGAFDFGSGLTAGLKLTYATLEPDGTDMNADMTSIAANGAYAFSNGASVGLYYENSTLTIDGGGSNSIAIRSYGIEGGYDMGAMSFKGFYGVSKTAPELGDVDITDIGLTFGYDMSAQANVSANLMRTRFESGGSSFDINLFEVGGSYQVSSAVALFGGLSYGSTDAGGLLDIDATTIGLGASYTFEGFGPGAAVLSAELARSSLDVNGTDAGSIDTVRLGLTIPLGAAASKTPLNSVAGSIENPRHSAVSGLILGAL